jgi:hypothetical protein
MAYIVVNVDLHRKVALKMNQSNMNKMNMIMILRYKCHISDFVNTGSFIYLFATFEEVSLSVNI